MHIVVVEVRCSWLLTERFSTVETCLYVDRSYNFKQRTSNMTAQSTFLCCACTSITITMTVIMVIIIISTIIIISLFLLACTYTNVHVGLHCNDCVIMCCCLLYIWFTFSFAVLATVILKTHQLYIYCIQTFPSEMSFSVNLFLSARRYNASAILCHGPVSTLCP